MHKKTFPIEAGALSGLRILLIVIPRSSLRDTCFFVGTASCDAHSIAVTDTDGQPRPPVLAPREALRGFDPATLARLIDADSFSVLAKFATDVEACVAVFAANPPSGGLVLRDSLFGLAEGAAGQPLLFQGDPELPRAEL